MVTSRPAAASFHVPDITARKNAGLPHAADFTLTQPLDRYSRQDQQTWALLLARQRALLPGRACDEFLAGLDAIGLPENRIPEFAELNRRLAATTGWQLVAVHGLIPDEVFFRHLAQRRFPVTWWIREAQQLDYLPEPDLFHDLFGHVPLLMNPVYADYLQAYGRGGLAARGSGALPMLARLYWYTVEFGLIATPQGLRIYGAGIVSSRSESVYCLDSALPNRLGFDHRRIMRTRYRIDTFQATYFVIDSLQQLFDATVELSGDCDELATLPELSALAVLDSDRVLQRGQPH
ncbi:MAG TPA: phenylalanine 4-monooxygenase [Rhodocyclaceae bacterium]|nr:phenylalanine 4-monooxygenase [Rhodocyclaceae bacterium]